jgi:hypothetical protein
MSIAGGIAALNSGNSAWTRSTVSTMLAPEAVQGDQHRFPAAAIDERDAACPLSTHRLLGRGPCNTCK